MAPVAQQPEVSLAQRLASNDKPVRSKALKTLRKYINVRSQKVQGGFSSEDLLKIWKGLFYCLWMQDKPLLQEELSHRISGLIHSFHTTDNQLLYFTTFLQTVKREWNGIDRLRMDKFFQLVRFMFRQTFEALKRKEWESRVVNQFLQIFTEQLLRNTEDAPKGLILHILDLYMTELALVGSAELTAEQNLTFIEPFCKTMAKTKDHFLLASVSKNVFMTIVDQAPYAIEDLMRELQRGGGEDSDSGQASGEEEEEEELKNKAPKKTKVKKFNGISEDMENSDGSKDDLDLDSVGERSEENDPLGPVLQFDYGAIADHLFELGSHLNTRNINRMKMYRLVKTFRDLSEGVFPQNEDRRKVRDSSDDDDDDDIFNHKRKKSKKKKRKNTRPSAGDETAAKKSKACQDEQKARDSLQDSAENPEKTENQNKASIELTDREKPIGPSRALPEAGESDSQSRLEDCSTVKKKRKNKKLKTNSQDVEEEKTDGPIVAKPPEQISLPGQLETTEPEAERRTMMRKKKRKSKNLCSSLEEVGEEVAVRSLRKEHNAGGEIGQLSTPQKIEKVKRKTLKLCSQEAEVVIKSPAILEDDQEISRHPRPTSEEDGVTQSSLKASTTVKKNPRKSKKLTSSSQEVDSISQDSCAEGTATDKVTSAEAQPSEALTVRTKKIKKKKETGSKLQVDLDAIEPEVSSKSAHSTANESKGDTAERSQLKSVKKAKKKKQVSLKNEEPTLEAGEQPVVEAVPTERTHTPCRKKKIQKKQEGQPAEEAKEPEVGTEARDAALSVDICTPRIKSLTPMKKGKKKRKLQGETSLSNGHAEEEMGGKKFKNGQDPEVSTSVTPKKLKMGKASPKSPKSDFISFQSLMKTPTPLFCKSKAKGSTPLSSTKQKFQTPKSETKKVTFGLKNNKTTEFRKTDSSLLVSPVGSSRVAFDPKKMPVSGVLKSPSPSPISSVKKSAAQKRATAADFF